MHAIAPLKRNSGSIDPLPAFGLRGLRLAGVAATRRRQARRGQRPGAADSAPLLLPPPALHRLPASPQRHAGPGRPADEAGRSGRRR